MLERRPRAAMLGEPEGVRSGRYASDTSSYYAPRSAECG